MIDKEVLYSVQPSFSPNIKLEPMSARSIRASPEKFPKAKTADKNKLSHYLENWDQVVERARFLKFSRQDAAGSQHRIEYDPQLVENQISFDKLNIYMPFADIVKLLKKRILKTASNLLDKSKDNIKHLNMKIFNRHLWKLDYKFSIKIDSESFDVDLTTRTPYHALNEILDQHRNLTHKVKIGFLYCSTHILRMSWQLRFKSLCKQINIFMRKSLDLFKWHFAPIQTVLENGFIVPSNSNTDSSMQLNSAQLLLEPISMAMALSLKDSLKVF